MANAVIMIIAIIVEEWPDGKEWKDDSVEKKLNSKLPSNWEWFGLGLPTRCLIIWVIKPTRSKYEKLKILNFFR